MCKALYKFEGKTANQLTFEAGDEFEIFAANSKGWFRGFLLPEKEQQGLIPQSYVKIIHSGEGKQCPKCGRFGTDAFCAACGSSMEGQKKLVKEEKEEEEKECSKCHVEGVGAFCAQCGGKMVAKKPETVEDLMEEVLGIQGESESLTDRMIAKIRKKEVDTTSVNFGFCTEGTSGVQLNDDELVELIEDGELDRTRILSLHNCRRLTHRAMQALGKLSNLTLLDLALLRDPNDFSTFQGKLVGVLLRKSGVSDKGMESLVSTCTNLKEIDLSFCTKLTPAGIALLGKLQSLEKAVLTKCNLNDNSLAKIGTLRNLKSLLIEEVTEITDTGIASISGLSNLSLHLFFPFCLGQKSDKDESYFEGQQEQQVDRKGSPEYCKVIEPERVAFLRS